MFGSKGRIAVSLMAATALTAGWHVALAQQQKADAASSAAEAPELQEVVVTGTMIKRANAETAEAITVIKADSLKDQGIVNVEQALNTLTSNTPAVNIA